MRCIKGGIDVKDELRKLRESTGMNLRRIMDKQGITAKNVQEYLGLGCVQSIYRWFNGQSMPTIDNLYALSELLSVLIDKLACGSRNFVRKIKKEMPVEKRSLKLVK